MKPLPVIVGFGGFNAAGRASFHHSYHRTIYQSLSPKVQRQTICSLAALMGLARLVHGSLEKNDGAPLTDRDFRLLEENVLNGSLVRQISLKHFDHNAVSQTIGVPGNNATIRLAISEIPERLPDGWSVAEKKSDYATIRISNSNSAKAEISYPLSVQSGGQLPDGFDLASLYKSRFHPRGLQLAIVGASDAIQSIGIDWNDIKRIVKLDDIGVYSASAMAQLDSHGTGGMLQARLKGKRVSSKQLPLGLNTMPADFINAYVLGNIGATGANAGACATFLYNLRLAVEDIQEGRRKVVVVGNAESPLEPEVIEGFAAMSALATDADLKKIDASDRPDYQRASRPFGENCGFTLGESGQYFVLMDDALAIELGANIHGSLLPVFVSADGFKKSISAPGPGNYITLAKAVSAAQNVFGSKIVRKRSFLQAHGSSTPQNRVTESRVFDTVAKAFDIHDWPVTAVKAFVGHSLAPASADQLTNALGVLREKVLPGIKTINAVAPDVFDERLTVAIKDIQLGEDAQLCFLNSKGFGGNNATGTVIAPELTESMLKNRYGAKDFNQYLERRSKIIRACEDYDKKCLEGKFETIYNFGRDLIEDEDISINEKGINIRGLKSNIPFALENSYKDMV
ncbi:MAG: beta-ketoacyl synthase [Pseudomonadota bacterium]|nr:beta-ketoacyl synthase [Pseudomonadota bacterium]